MYRAEDTTLKREVAIKVLPERFTQDTERLARFEREAQVLASLNHQNIAAIHSFEHSDGVHFLAMELVEGETLAQRVAKGPLPVEEALEVSRQLAEGLEAAHESGVIHRDLKPANINITPEGKVKILDFGLAKALEGEIPAADISQSPTRTGEMTSAGVILGTAAYMSPEQARGKPVDKRTDIWAFGCVLYEMLTGNQVFSGETATDILGAIVHKDPDWEALPEGTPRGIRRLLRRSLERDPHERLRDIGDARIEIGQAVNDPGGADTVTFLPQQPIPLWRQPTAITAVALALVIGLAAAWLLKPAPPLPEPPLRKLTLEWGEDIHRPVISPDGRHVAYLRGPGGLSGLWIRDLDQEGPRQLVPEGLVFSPFWSADSQFIGFVLDAGLKKVSLQGGPAATLCRVSGPMRGATWSPDGASIVFAAISPTPGLYEVPAQGGEPQLLFEPEEDRYRAPHFLPSPGGGRRLLYSVGLSGQRQIVAHDLETGQKEFLTSGVDPFFATTGHILYGTVDRSALWAIPFSIETLQATGEPFPVRENASDHSVSRDGTLVYLGGGDRLQQLVWRDRTGGNLEAIGQPQERIRAPALSPDGSRVAVVGMENGNRDVWVHDIVRGLKTRVTSNPAGENRPNWLPSGDEISFSSNRNGTVDIFVKSADGRGEAEVLVATPAAEFPFDWTADGNYMIFDQRHAGREMDLYYLRRDKDGSGYESIVFSETEFDELSPRISPDGRFVAYQSNESGSYEVYVQPFPEGPGRTQVSSKGGQQPRWSGDGKEIFYVEGDALMAVPVGTTPTFSAETPTLLFQGKGAFADRGHSYDVSADGKRFVIVEPVPGGKPPTIQVVENWYEEFREREQD